MVRMKKIKSGRKYYYYIIRDVYDSFHQRSTTEVLRKATDQEIAEYESLEQKKINAKYRVRLYLKNNEIKFLDFDNYDSFFGEIIEILKSPDTKKVIINYL